MLVRLAEVLRVDIEEFTGSADRDETGRRAYAAAPLIEQAMMGYGTPGPVDGGDEPGREVSLDFLRAQARVRPGPQADARGTDARGRSRRARGAGIRSPGVARSPGATEEVGPGRVVVAVVVEGEGVEEGKTRVRAVQLGEGHGAVELYHR